MLMPKRSKHRKVQRGRMKGVALRGNRINYGEYGIVAQEPCWVKSRQLEAARVAITRYMKRVGKVWIKVFPDKPYSLKPLGTRMGKGKGNLEGWVAVVRPGKVLFEVTGVPEDIAKEALRLGGSKLPLKTKIYSKADLDKIVDAKLNGEPKEGTKSVKEEKGNEE